jgi:uncharacterized membrane protein
MRAMMLYLLALGIGVVAGLRAMTAPAAVSWGAYLGMIHVGGTWLAFLARPWTPWVLTVLALAELVGDQLPKTPSRKVPVQFGTRIVTGALSGAAIGAGGGAWLVGALCGAVGAVIGTLGGAAARASLARSFGRDLPAALLEDAVAIGAALLIIVLA